jgi:hydrogenase maturation protease
MSADRSGIIIIGIGNEFRGDDGAGIAVARLLRGRTAPPVTIREESGEGAALMDAWKDAAAAILVDAVQSGAPPGTIHRIDASTDRVPSKFFHYSTHAFSVAEAVELARAMNQLPERLIVYGIEGESFAAGVLLSSTVERAVRVLAETILGEIPRTL